MRVSSQQGSHHIILSLVIVVLGVVGFAGYRVMHHAKTTTSGVQQAVKSMSLPSTIQTTKDLQQAATSLDSSSSDLNSSLDTSSLNSSLNDLL